MPALDAELLKTVYDLQRKIIWGVRVDPPDSTRFTFLFFTNKYREVVGVGHQELAGKSPYECLPTGDAIKITEKYSECVESNSDEPFVYNESLEIGGEHRWWRTSLTPVRDEQGRIILLIGESSPVERLEADLRNAIATHQLEVHYQPIVRVDGVCKSLLTNPSIVPYDCISGLEALIRWPGSGYHPGQFIPVAEASGLLPEITRMVLLDACNALSRVESHLWISVNVSDCDFVDDLDFALARHDVDRARLALEITESTTFTQSVIDRFNGLIIMGSVIKFDDWGTLQSNLSWLQALKQVSAIKLDISFVKGVASDRNKQAICEASISLAQKYDPPIIVIAEGVQNMDDFMWLFERGVDEYQGFLFAKPSPLP